jgi:hypothetical protein
VMVGVGDWGGQSVAASSRVGVWLGVGEALVLQAESSTARIRRRSNRFIMTLIYGKQMLEG